MHLVSWEIIKRPISEGGLNIRDPELVNLPLGGKLLWQSYSNKNHPVSKIFRKKYLKGIPMRNINSANSPKGTSIWNLCRRGLDNFQLQLYRIPGSGKRTLLWEDKIMGNLPFSSNESLSEIKDWLSNKGFLRLRNIFSWDRAGNWVGWSFPDIPDYLIPQQNMLVLSLTSCAPVNCFLKDGWGWGSTSNYSVALGFKAIQLTLDSRIPPAI